jgi:hypothetical protein
MHKYVSGDKLLNLARDEVKKAWMLLINLANGHLTNKDQADDDEQDKADNDLGSKDHHYNRAFLKGDPSDPNFSSTHFHKIRQAALKWYEQYDKDGLLGLTIDDDDCNGLDPELQRNRSFHTIVVVPKVTSDRFIGFQLSLTNSLVSFVVIAISINCSSFIACHCALPNTWLVTC